jgi:hypothetical protein
MNVRSFSEKASKQWLRLLGASEELKAFLEDNKNRLKLKDEG